MSRVIYIDDEALLCRVMELTLQRAGLEVRTFTDPHEALASIERDPPNVILCDYQMPKMSGLELLARLPRRIPFYLVSGDLEIEDLQTVGVAGVLTKPFLPGQVLRLMKSHCDPEG